MASGLVVLAAASRLAPGPPPSPDASASRGAASVARSAAPPAASSARWPGLDAGNDDAASCSIPDRGLGSYGDWQTLPVGRMSAPQPLPGDDYDLLLHLHGGEAARRVVAPEDLGLVLVTVDAGIGSRVYAETFYGPEPLEDLLGAVDTLLAPARLRHLILSSWSAGYGGVREILTQTPTVPAAVILLDSVHASYSQDGESLVETGLEPFVSLSQRAVDGEAVMVLTHSSIRPPGYASTSEVADHLLARIGGRRRYGGLLASHGVELKTRFDRGDLHLRGYTGTSKEAHCAHVRMLADVLREDVLPALKDRVPSGE